jgi:4-hydroxy-tetrahydrodipicolinate synthase
MIDKAWVRSSLTGPVTAVHPAFTRNGDLDEAGIANHIEHNLAAGTHTILLTYGDSLHSILTDRDVGDLLKIVVRATNKRAMVVAADRQWWTGAEVRFADFAREEGADLLMVLPPHWGGSVTEDSLVAHYAAVAEHIPVMLVTALFYANQALGLRVIPRLRDEVPGIVAIKDDVVGDFARRVTTMIAEPWAMMSGGLKVNHLDLHPYGAIGYMSTFMHWYPPIAHAYWRAIQSNDMTRAAEICRDYDHPFMDIAGELPGGFDAVYHGNRELVGITGRWRRPPYHSLTDAEMDRLREWWHSLPPLDGVAPASAIVR